eukprot:TRINITY_DN31373_c0_g1_i1.p1 TRINITY_DN31373_c0_g1~~TRINITY_DN31373_c0_g1_i1.p1  ORF type:complete len:129 (-),score=31.51 TRINITY_DN31373_c0_g1_i1:349-735(-)
MIRRPPRSTLSSSSAASDVYKRQPQVCEFPAEIPMVSQMGESCAQSVANTQSWLALLAQGSDLVPELCDAHSQQTLERALGQATESAVACATAMGDPAAADWIADAVIGYTKDYMRAREENRAGGIQG